MNSTYHGHRQILQQRLDTGHLEVGVGVGQEMMGQGVADLKHSRCYELLSRDEDTHPPLPMTHQRQVKVESPPLSLTVSKMKPIVTAVVGHSQEQSLDLQGYFHASCLNLFTAHQ